MSDSIPSEKKVAYPGEGHPWSDYLHHEEHYRLAESESGDAS